jgi:hypothetical protein
MSPRGSCGFVVTAVILMTLIYGLILNRALLYFVGALTPSTWPDEPDALSKESRTYAIFEAISGVGFVEPLHNPTLLPDEKGIATFEGSRGSLLQGPTWQHLSIAKKPGIWSRLEPVCSVSVREGVLSEVRMPRSPLGISSLK